MINKILISLTVLLVLVTFQTNGSICTSIQNGNWNNSTTWSCNRVPQNNDTIIINYNVTISNSLNYNYLYIKVYNSGNFIFNNEVTLSLNCNSIIWMELGGYLYGKEESKIKINNQTVWLSECPNSNEGTCSLVCGKTTATIISGCCTALNLVNNSIIDNQPDKAKYSIILRVNNIFIKYEYNEPLQLDILTLDGQLIYHSIDNLDISPLIGISLLVVFKTQKGELLKTLII